MELTHEDWGRWRTDKVTKQVKSELIQFMDETAHELAEGVEEDYYKASVGKYQFMKLFIERYFEENENQTS